MDFCLMEIPCYFMSQIDGPLVQIDAEFHDDSMSFVQILFVFRCSNMTMPWMLDKAKSWNFHGICQENDWISIGFGLIPEPNQTAVKKTQRKSVSHFLQGFSYGFLTVGWFGSKMRPNPMAIPSFSWQMPWKFHNLNFSEIHVTFLHGQQINMDK